MANLRAWWRWLWKELYKTSRGMWLLVLFISIFLMFSMFILLVLSGHYLNKMPGILPPQPDILHEILPHWHTAVFIFQIGFVVSIIFFIIGALHEPHRMPYLFFMIVLWALIRIASTTVTKLGGPAGLISEFPQITDMKSIWDFIVIGLASPHILFFSGHTGLPFLGYLIFKRPVAYKMLFWPMVFISLIYLLSWPRYTWWLVLVLASFWILIVIRWNKFFSLSALFLLWSFVMAVCVLVTRNHYSVDVLGAYFMTGGIVLFGKYWFSKIEQLCEKMESAFSNKKQ